MPIPEYVPDPFPEGLVLKHLYEENRLLKERVEKLEKHLMSMRAAISIQAAVSKIPAWQGDITIMEIVK